MVFNFGARSRFLNIIQFRSKLLRLILNAPWYEVRNDVIQNGTKTPTIVEEETNYCFKYNKKLKTQVNNLAMDLLDNNDHVHSLRSEDVLTLQFRNF